MHTYIADELSYRCEALGVLPKTHFGARPGYSTTDAVHYLVSTIKDKWRKKRVVSALYLDIKGAFPSIVIDTLLCNLKCLGIPREITKWLEWWYRGHKTVITFDDFES